MLKHYLYILLAIFYACGLLAQGNGQANIIVDSTTFLIGDPIQMQVIVNAPVGNTVTFPAISDLLNKEKLELIDQKETETIQGDVNNTFKKTIVFTAWEPGNYQIPKLVFSYTKGGNIIEIESASLMVTATAPTVTGDSTYIADIKTILAEERNFWDKVYAFFTHPVVLSLLILGLAFLAFYSFMQYKNRPKAKRKPTAEEIALKQLDALKAKNLLGDHQFQAFHTDISLILRTYINNRFKISALERPTSAFLPKLEQHKYMPSKLFEEGQTVLEHADLIKFAKASPLDIANTKALDYCYTLINSVTNQLKEEAELAAKA